MIEVKLVSINFSVQPIKDGDGKDAKQLNLYHRPTETAYLAPFSAKSIDLLIEDLQMPNEELELKIQKQLAEQQIQVAQPGDKLQTPDGVVDLSDLK